MDVFTHALESYVSTGHNEFSAALDVYKRQVQHYVIPNPTEDTVKMLKISALDKS